MCARTSWPTCWFLFAASWALLAGAEQPAGPRAESEAPAGHKRAILVGVNDYAELSDLRYSERDILLLRDRLVAAGFPAANVVVLSDRAEAGALRPFKANVQEQLRAMLGAAGPDDLVVFAFSGHGLEWQGASYLCPIEARLDDPRATLLSLEELYQGLSAAKARQKVMLIDACRGDPQPGGQKALVRATDSLAAFARSLSAAPQGLIVVSSCTPGQVSIEDDALGHGVFMYFVLRGLEGEADRDGGNGDNRISLFELFRYANAKTKAHVARTRDLVQTPVLRAEITQDYDLARVPARPPEVEIAWNAVVRQPDAMVSDSRALAWISKFLARMGSQAPDQAQTRRTYERVMKRPEAILLANPAVITAKSPEALLALQRAYAFAMRSDWDGALAASTEAARLEPENPFAYLLRGMVYLARENLALKTLTKMSPEVLANLLGNESFAGSAPMFLDRLARDFPELVAQVPAARANPQALVALLTKAAEQSRAMENLEKAMADYGKINLGLPVSVEPGAPFKVGEEVVATASSGALYEATGVRGDWVWVKDVPEVKGPGAWVARERVMALSFLRMAQPGMFGF